MLIIPFTTFAKDIVNIGTVVSPPFVIKSNTGEFSGITFELWNKIAHSLNMESNIKEYKSIDNLLDALDNGEIDVTVYSLTINHERLTKYNFSQACFNSEVSVLSKYKETKWYDIIINAEIYKLLLVLIALLSIVGLLVWLVEWKANDQFDFTVKGFFNSFYYVAIVMTTTGLGDFSCKTVFGKIITMVWMYISLGITSMFIGGISSQMTISNINNDIENISDLKKSKCACVDNTFASDYLDRNGIRHLKYNSLTECFDDLEDGNLESIVYDKPQMIYQLKQRDLDGFKIGNKSFTTQSYGFASKRDFDMTKINIELYKILESEEWKRYINNYLN